MSTEPKTVAFHTMGCKLNFSETSTISRDFIQQGFKKVHYCDRADIYVINTCSVTDNADKEARKLVRQAKRQNPDSSVAVIGCYAQLKPDEIANLDGVDIVLGAGEKFNLLDHLDEMELSKDTTVFNSSVERLNDFKPSFSIGERTRSYLKVQDGCDYTCSFCTIPLARGRSRSADIKTTMKIAREIATHGVKEIVLTGVNVGDFGHKEDETFLDLISELDKLNNIERIRVSSIEPNLLNESIIEFCNSSKLFMPHYHMPLQSGSNKLLKAMRRRYDRDHYRNKVNLIKSLDPSACIGADVIVGFPGETDDDFLDTYNFLNELDITYLHVFTYSERRGTEAVQIREKVQRGDRSKRSKILRDLSREKQRIFNNKFINTIRPVLFEGIKNGYLVGYTDNYIKAQVKIQTDLNNQIVKTSLIKNNGDYVIGSI